MLRVLIVDDNYEYLEGIFNNLNDHVNSRIKVVKICNDGEKALNYIINTELDVILLDLNIPKMNGLEILEKMKENNIKREVVVISGDSDLILKLISKKLNVTQILIKPFGIEELLEIFETIFSDRLKDDRSNKVEMILNKFAFNKSNKGYEYIEECLQYCIEKRYTSIPKMEILCMNISLKKDKISQYTVGWNVSKAIQTMKRLTKPEIFKKYFPYNSSPSPKAFLNEILNLYYNLKEDV